ncbi:hypothetical protein B1C78_13685 [Thioalkalivibrio denitrificans]|uniref:Lcl C-terminal domain-containing protein n=1 Tax=Thioalkalivibrio denitrificans TaxID=108003 RepID=A0A1V3NCP0_9GAMM|nr:hypothetical protein B1C78_13685 [Thioalkalivibrio denitrificans]
MGLLTGTAVQADGADRFTLPGPGLVEDHRQGLVWMRCSLGQRPDGDRCSGEAERLTWSEANRRVEALASRACPWRLPEFHELRSLLQPSGAGPALDRTAFPDTPDGWFWTRVRAGGHSQYDCFVDFAGSGRTRCNMGGRFYLRPVMSRDQGVEACIFR